MFPVVTTTYGSPPSQSQTVKPNPDYFKPTHIFNACLCSTHFNITLSSITMHCKWPLQVTSIAN